VTPYLTFSVNNYCVSEIANYLSSNNNTGGNKVNGNTVGGSVKTGKANSNSDVKNNVCLTTTNIIQQQSSLNTKNTQTGPGSSNLIYIFNR
jgi:hypothetical protein